jgi:hypothetical protein
LPKGSVTETTPIGSTVGRGTILKRLFAIAYVTAVAVAMFGWVSAFWWITVRVTRWLLA